MALTRKTLNIFLRTASLLLLLVGISIGLSGVFLLLGYRSMHLFFSSFYIILPALLAAITGVFLLWSGGIGCVAASKESSCFQALFVYFLIIVCCAVASTAVLAYIHKGNLDVDLAPIENVFQNYSSNSRDPDTCAVNALQSELQCCGVKNYSDWLETPWFNRSGNYKVPQSCCNKTFETCNGTLDLPELLYHEGCQIKLKEKLQLLLVVVLLESLVIVIVLVMSCISVGKLMRYQPPQEYQILDQG